MAEQDQLRRPPRLRQLRTRAPIRRRSAPVLDGRWLYPPDRTLSYTEARFELSQYEGRRALFTASRGVLLCVPFLAVPPGLLALSIFVVPGGVLAYAVGLVSLCTASLPGWAYQQRLWERPVRNRVAWRLRRDPRVATVSVIVQEQDESASWRALHRAGLVIPYSTRRAHVGADLRTSQIAVAQWAERAQLDDFAFRDIVCEVFRAAGIWVNVGGVEVGSRPA